MRFITAAMLLCGCAGAATVDEPPLGSGGGEPGPAPEQCAFPNVGAAPRLCASSDDCFWSQCASSRCEDGACVHETVPDGTACFVDVNLNVGTCGNCLCVIET